MDHTGSQQPNTCTYPDPDQSSEPASSTYFVTYFLAPWSRDLLEKLTGLQLVKKFPAFYGTRRFITAFTRARHLSLSWARSIQYMPPIPLIEDASWYYPLIYVWVFQVSFPKVSPPKTLCAPLLYLIRATCTANLSSQFDQPTNTRGSQ